MKGVIASLDCEADGTDPILNNLLQIGIVIYDQMTRQELDSFSINISPVFKRVKDEKTVNQFFKQENPEAWANINKDALPVTSAMYLFACKYTEWLASYKTIKWICKPVSFDWPFLRVYYSMYAPYYSVHAPLTYRAHCLSAMIDSYISTIGLSPAHKMEVEALLRGKHEHKHQAVDDAREQACMYFTLRDLQRGIKHLIRNPDGSALIVQENRSGML